MALEGEIRLGAGPEQRGDLDARVPQVLIAALAAGFADAAHLTRTFRRMVGIPPSAIARSVTFMERLA